ncbi:hypothetical protein COT72_00110 [archaeon CG10_big_fil_rev_8_21_14_0_10_43_11]|nr:MAG: hypothetical protein COT72_00110 [archaeon CG10_big_fil_rev_8_21_14_0_10_43_11]
MFMTALRDSTKLTVPGRTLILFFLIIITQILLASSVIAPIVSLRVHPVLTLAKAVLSIIMFVLVFIYIQAFTSALILRILRPSLTRQHLLSTNLVSTGYFIPLIPFGQIIIPFLRLCGAKIGKGVVFSIGTTILEPNLLEVGEGTQFGAYTLITGHVTEKDHTLFKTVRIGRNALIGAKSIIMPGVVIGDSAIIATGSLVPKSRTIPKKSVWGGVPARKIK